MRILLLSTVIVSVVPMALYSHKNDLVPPVGMTFVSVPQALYVPLNGPTEIVKYRRRPPEIMKCRDAMHHYVNNTVRVYSYLFGAALQYPLTGVTQAHTHISHIYTQAHITPTHTQTHTRAHAHTRSPTTIWVSRN